MLLLLGAAITASFIDSLNPSAIAQQILLQAMVKSKRQILFFISGIGLANLTMGLAIYYGSASWIVQAYSAVTTAYPVYPYGSETATSLLFLTIGIRLIVKTVRCQSNDNLEKISTPKPPAWLALFSVFHRRRFLWGETDQRIAVFGAFSHAGKLPTGISVGAHLNLII